MDHFRGTLEECLDQLRMSPRSVLSHFIEFVEAHPKTVAGWIMGTDKPPAGEFWVRSVLFFDLIGWKVIEFEKTELTAVTIAKLWMYKLMSADQVREELGYASASNTPLLEYIYGKRLPILSVRKLADALAARYRELISDAEEELREKYRPVEPEAATTEVGDDIVGRLAALLRTAQPLVSQILSDTFTDEDREQLRALVGREEFVELAVQLSALKSYRNRNQLLGR